MAERTTKRPLTGKVITLVGRSEPAQDFIEKALWRWVYSRLDQFTIDLEIARRVYQATPELVVAPEMPAHLEAIANTLEPTSFAAADMAWVRQKVLADPALANIVMEARQETMADPVFAKVVMDDARKLMREDGTASSEFCPTL